MNLIEKLTMQDFHEHRVKDFGDHSVKALGWKNNDSQLKRFEIMAEIADFNHSTVLDVGCGHGDLKPFLDERYTELTYIGVDHIEPFIEAANARYKKDESTHFVQGDFSKLFFPDVDYVIGSGAFGYKCDREEYYFEAIIHLFKMANKAAAFNMLDERTFPAHPLLRGHNRKMVVEFCKRLTRKVAVIDGYLEDDFTVVLRR